MIQTIGTIVLTVAATCFCILIFAFTVGTIILVIRKINEEN